MMDKLPQELIDKIISSVGHTRPSALLACSRVSRSWRRQAQRGLFYRISLNEKSLKKWDHDISPECEIPSYVHCLVWEVWRAPDPSLETTFPGHFTSFSNIGALSLPVISLSSLDVAGIKRIFGHISYSLRRLAISSLETDPEKLCLFVSLLPNLRYMYTPFVTMLEGGSSPNCPTSFDFTGHIGPYRPETEQYFRCIAGLRPRFETLEARVIDDELIDTFNLVMQGCSATLSTILITLPVHGMMEGNSSQSKLFIADRIQPAIDEMDLLDLSPCRNLRALRVDPGMADHPQFDALLQTISSKHFEKLIVTGRKGSPYRCKNDQVLRSFAERLRKLGATKPLTMVLEHVPQKWQGMGHWISSRPGRCFTKLVLSWRIITVGASGALTRMIPAR